MRPLALFMLALCGALSVFAKDNGLADLYPSTMRCTEAQWFVQREGAVLVSYENIFGLTVTDTVQYQNPCRFPQIPRRLYVKTLDEEICFIGYNWCDDDDRYRTGN